MKTLFKSKIVLFLLFGGLLFSCKKADGSNTGDSANDTITTETIDTVSSVSDSTTVNSATNGTTGATGEGSTGSGSAGTTQKGNSSLNTDSTGAAKGK